MFLLDASRLPDVTDNLKCSHNSIAYSQNKQKCQIQQLIKDFTEETSDIPMEKRTVGP